MALKQPYPWLEAFGFRIADRVSILDKNGEWSFRKATTGEQAPPGADCVDACVGTTDDPNDELAWTDAATAENQRLQTRLRDVSEAARRENAALAAENERLRRQVDAAALERKKLELERQKDRERMEVRVGARPMRLEESGQATPNWKGSCFLAVGRGGDGADSAAVAAVAAGWAAGTARVVLLLLRVRRPAFPPVRLFDGCTDNGCTDTRVASSPLSDSDAAWAG
jgi:hypothetical protein